MNRSSYKLLAVGLTCFASLTCVARVHAELTVIEDAEGQQGLTVHRMTVTPAAEPVPALKHRFVVPLHKSKPGNAATHYLRSFGEFSPNDRWRRITDKYGEQVYDWYEYDMPVDELPMQGFREAARMFQKLVDDFIASASRCRHCDWGLHEMDLTGIEVLNYRLSEAQESRAISRGLSLVSRLAIIDGDYAKAIDFIRMNYQLGQDISKQRFLVCSLIGMAEVGMANKSVIELISAAESPNLYWALSELPSPIIDMREALNLEMSFGLRMFPVLLDAEERKHTPEEWTRLLTTMVDDFTESLDSLGNLYFPRQKTLAQFGAMGMSMVVYPAAKQRLIDAGRSSHEVESMPVAQVLILDAAREFQIAADNFEKWSFVPYQQMPAVKLDAFSPADGFGRLLAHQLLPAVQAARTAQMRTQWQLDALRVVEALRMHAAVTGEFPASLDEIDVVPVPKNPITQESFAYRLDGKTAVLELPFSDGMPGAAWRFEMQLAN